MACEFFPGLLPRCSLGTAADLEEMEAKQFTEESCVAVKGRQGLRHIKEFLEKGEERMSIGELFRHYQERRGAEEHQGTLG